MPIPEQIIKVLSREPRTTVYRCYIKPDGSIGVREVIQVWSTS